MTFLAGLVVGLVAGEVIALGMLAAFYAASERRDHSLESGEDH